MFLWDWNITWNAGEVAFSGFLSQIISYDNPEESEGKAGHCESMKAEIGE